MYDSILYHLALRKKPLQIVECIVRFDFASSNTLKKKTLENEERNFYVKFNM